MEPRAVLLSIAVSLVITWLFLNRRRCKDRPPGPIPLPIIGNLLQLGPKPHQSLSALAKTYGPLLSLQLGSVTVVVASSPDAAKEIFQKNDQSFPNRPILESVAAQPNVNDTLAWAPADNRWRNRRRICTTQIFTAQRLDLLQDLRHRNVHQLIKHVQKRSATGTQVDVGELAFATMLNLVSNTVFSVDLVDPEFETAGEFKELVWRIMEDAGKLNLADYFPALKRFDLQGVRRHVRVSYERLHEIFDDLIQKRLKEREDSSALRNGDFLDVLLDHCQPEDGSDFTVESIKPLILDLFIAGSDTSGSTTEWAMAELLRNPEIMRKARTELNQVIGNNIGQIKESDIPRLPYIQAIVKETLRLHPSVPLLLPYIAANDVVVTGYTIHKGDQLLINAWSIGRNPSYWDNPTSFLPERFLAGSAPDFKGRDFEYLPFGGGRRICPGLPLANRMISLMVATLVHSFEWDLPKGMTPETMDMNEQYGITLKKAVPLCLVPKSV
ncbi:geraniol 8-hydroxylase-like [Neltuma alba]|uniref:geraniol 8-hydroxylase-like n=1 Tax=Neltuma alba TaxID=207710 RepID=UPI0010A2BFBE|nr:geraniol 8-hydroxylase-like [Prosopis alba]XP_028772187.1 geraniol 8-hydroxylase-like [Prosopis alba]